MNKKGIPNLIKEVLCDPNMKVTKEQVDVFEEIVKELRHAEFFILRALSHKDDIEYTAKAYELPPKYIKYMRRKAIRHLRTPIRWLRLQNGWSQEEESNRLHFGETPISACGFTTKTTNVLKKNHFEYIEELREYVGKVPIRFTYIDGLGRIGMSEILAYFMDRDL